MGDFHPDLVAAIERIRKAAVDNGKKAGIYSADGDSASKYAEQGFHMVGRGFYIQKFLYPFRPLALDADVNMQISVISDVAALTAHLSNSLNTARARL